MSEFLKELHLTSEFCQERELDAFTNHVPIEWIEEALKQTGKASVRKRRFPTEQAVWLVLGIGLLRNRSIAEVCDKLELPFLIRKVSFLHLQRWEIEQGYGELKQYQLPNKPVLRS